jgi:hypothetical protein
MKSIRDDRTGLYLPDYKRPPDRNGLRFLFRNEWENLAPSTKKYLLPQMTGGMDGAYYWDTRLPFISGPTQIAAVTLAATAKALYTAGAFPVLGANYFGFPGKKLRIRMAGRVTTAATPGNGSFNVLYGTGADANGTLLMTGGPVALTASQTSISWWGEWAIYCATIGATGTLFCMGIAHFGVTVIASTLQPIMMPANTPAVSGAVDLTSGTLIPSIQYLRSGSTAETMQVHDLEVVAVN